MPDTDDQRRYECLAEAELVAAAERGTPPKTRDAHLNRAAEYATLAELAGRVER